MANNLFDPRDFDTPSPKGPPASPPAADPGADYRTLLDAMRKAGAEGVGEATNRILAAIQKDAEARSAWQNSTAPTLTALHDAAGAARSAAENARQATTWLGLRALLLAAGAALAVGVVSWASLAWQRSQVDDLKAQRDSLSAEIAADQAIAAKLKLRGAELEWSTCTVSGTFRDKQRKCIRVAADQANGTAVSGYTSGQGTPTYAIPEGY